MNGAELDRSTVRPVMPDGVAEDFRRTVEKRVFPKGFKIDSQRGLRFVGIAARPYPPSEASSEGGAMRGEVAPYRRQANERENRQCY